jgi:hypothetical protein
LDACEEVGEIGGWEVLGGYAGEGDDDEGGTGTMKPLEVDGVE